jgi:hypothetical protein
VRIVSFELYLALKDAWESSDGGSDNHRTIPKEHLMARVIVTTDPTELRNTPVLLDEHVCSAHLADNHAATQLIERLGWAITDAENTERTQRAAAERVSN